MRLISLIAACFVANLSAADPLPSGKPWPLYTIDGSSTGADGVKVSDVNGDGLPDIATGWEEGGVLRIYQHPGHADARKPWPMTEVASIGDLEDAEWADIDGDGAWDVLGCSEGKTMTLTFCFAPTGGEEWITKPLAISKKKRWMFARRYQADNQHGIDFVVGSKNRKNKTGTLGLLLAPARARDIKNWTYKELTPANWTMSIWTIDMDNDGDEDICYSDRRKPLRGVYWLERPDNPLTDTWHKHLMWTGDVDIMSTNYGDLDSDGIRDWLVAVADTKLIWLRGTDTGGKDWEPIVIPTFSDSAPTRSANPGDLDGDGDMDIAITTWQCTGKHGVYWLQNNGQQQWTLQTISGNHPGAGIKFDHSELLDIDGDGDLDLLTCEEREKDGGGLGVIWYANPQR